MIDLEDYSIDALLESAHAPIWIRENSELEAHCVHWSNCSVIALDTEFIRTDTFYAIPGLIQLADERACYLIDPLTIDQWEPFSKLMTDTSVIKVFHSPAEDLELLHHCYGILPMPLLDTQLAATYVGIGSGLGLQRLLKRMLDVDLEKGETRSDWLQRPLTPEQERYAALDVAYLPKVALMLFDELERLDRLHWIEEDTTRVLQAVMDQEKQIDEYYLRFSNCANLAVYRQAALRDLTRWREIMIRELNVPRVRFMNNNAIIDCVERKIKVVGDLAKIKGIRGYVIGDYGYEIVDIVRQAKLSAKEDPPELIPKPLKPRWQRLVKELNKKLMEIAEELDIPPDVLAKRRDLELLVRNYLNDETDLPEALTGWRAEQVVNPLNQLLHELRPRPV